MRCKGKIKRKNKLGKNVLEQCNFKLDDNAIFCPECGEPTEALANDLSAWKNFTQVVSEFWPRKNEFLSFGLVMFFIVLLPILAVEYFVDNYWISNLILLFIVPLALVPFANDAGFLSNGLTANSLTGKLKHYLPYLAFTLLNILFFLLIKILCTGFLLNVATDPILHPARLVLVLYWLAIVMPVPLLMVRYDLCPMKAVKKSYHFAAETRWQHFFLYMLIALLNIIGAAVLVVGLLITIPLSYVIIERYFQKLEIYCNFDK